MLLMRFWMTPGANSGAVGREEAVVAIIPSAREDLRRDSIRSRTPPTGGAVEGERGPVAARSRSELGLTGA